MRHSKKKQENMNKNFKKKKKKNNNKIISTTAKENQKRSQKSGYKEIKAKKRKRKRKRKRKTRRKTRPILREKTAFLIFHMASFVEMGLRFIFFSLFLLFYLYLFLLLSPSFSSLYILFPPFFSSSSLSPSIYLYFNAEKINKYVKKTNIFHKERIKGKGRERIKGRKRRKCTTKIRDRFFGLTSFSLLQPLHPP